MVKCAVSMRQRQRQRRINSDASVSNDITAAATAKAVFNPLFCGPA